MNIEDLLRNELLEVKRKEVEKTNVLTMLNRLLELLPRKLGVKQTCEQLVRIIIAETDFENCSIALWNPQEKNLPFVAAFGLPELLEEEVHVPYHRNLMFSSDQDIAGQVFSSRESVFIEDTRVRPIPPKISAVINPACLVCLPLLDLGVLNMSASHSMSMTPEKRRNWVLLGNIIGQLVTTASLNERLSDANQLLEHEVDRKTRALEEKNHELAVANQLLEVIIDHSPDGICLLDASGVIRRINRSMEKLLGEGVHRAIGSSPGVFFQDPKTFDSLLEGVSKNGRKHLLDVFLLGPDAGVKPVDIFLTKISDELRGVTGYLLVIYDITEKKAFSEQLLRTEKLAALGTMAGGVAHDFNNMLMRILGNTQLLLLQAEDRMTRHRLQNIESAVQDAALTLKRLQTFAGKESEDHGAAGVADVSEVISEVVQLTRPRWKNSLEKHGHTIDLRLDLAPACSAHMSPSDLREVLTNIFLNAVDAMPNGGIMEVKSGCEGDAVFIEVRDSGPGIPEEVQRKIFDPFFTTKGVGNSGLGLSVSWKLVHRHKGEISVASQPESGSVFRIVLPRAENQPQSIIPVGKRQDPASRRVLLVDDDSEILRLLKDMIRMNGHKVDATLDGHEALRLIENEEFDLILSDMGMPVVSGWEIAKRAKEKNPLVPVILITGWGTQYEEEDLSREGIDLVLSKPLGYEKLKGVLQKFL